MQPIGFHPAANRNPDKRYDFSLFVANNDARVIAGYYRQMRKAGMTPFNARSILYMSILLGRHARTGSELDRLTRKFPQVDNAF